MDKNFLLSSLQMLILASELLKADTREQLSRVNLISIKMYVVNAREKMVEQRVRDTYTAGVELRNAVEVIDTMLADSSFKETDTDTKEFIVSKIQSATRQIYKVCGVYYTTNDFDYSPGITNLLNKIIDECLRQGYYFGIEV